MPKVTLVKCARKAIPSAGIEVGQPYYWWKFRFGGKHVSKTYPKPSQLTQSEFLQQIYDINDRLEAVDESTAADEVPAIIDELDNIISELEDKLGNMPDSLQQAPTGELLQNRIDAVTEMKDALEGVDLDCFDTDNEPTDPESIELPDEPEAPVEPSRIDFNDDNDFEEAMTSYNEELEAYNTAKEAYDGAVEAKDEAESDYEDWQSNRESAIEEIQGVSYSGE
jgi:hypothetical protein